MNVAEARCGNQLINSRNNSCVTLERPIHRGTWLKTFLKYVINFIISSYHPRKNVSLY